nr:MAG TPA: Trichohyalin-plectin-homology domain [Crassvirales sp.]
MSKRVVLSDVEKVDLPEIPVIEEVRQIRFTKDMELVTEVADPDLFMIQRAENIDEHPKIITLENIIKCMAGDMEEGGYKFITGDTLFKIVGDMTALVTWDNSNLVNALNETYKQVLQTNQNLQDEIDRSTTTDIDHDTRINNNRQDIISNTDLIHAETGRAQAEENKIRQEIADYKAQQAIRDDNQDKALQAEIDRAEGQEAAIRKEMDDRFVEQAAKDLAQDNALNKEIQNRKDADDAILEGIARDKVTQAAKDKEQDDALAAEVTRAKGQEAAIRSEMAEEKRLQGIKDAAQDKALADEVTRAKAKENQIQANLDAEIARATQEEQDIYANLGDEITRAVTREDEIERKFTEWDNDQDNRLELLESLTHEQNTDTGTDKVSFQLAMKNSGPRIKSESGGLSARNAADSAYVNFRAKDVTVDGDLIVKGQQSIIQSQTVEVADNTLLLNKGEVGPGVTKGFAGIEIDRGTEPNFFFGFNESDDMFKIGKEGSMMDVALRETVENMNDGMFVSWNAAKKALETTNTLPANHKITFKGTDTTMDFAIRNSADLFRIENPAVAAQHVSLRFVNNRATLDTGTTHFHFLKPVFVPGYIASANSKLGIGIGNNTTEVVVIDASKITSTKPIHATTFYRSSDSSEVLYKANIVNDVTTGGATNVLSAEQGKLLAQGITQVEGSYLPLSGGTITGDLTTNKGILIAADEAIKFPLLIGDEIYNADALASINETLTIGVSWKKILVGGSNTTITYQAKELITGLSTNIGRSDRRFNKIFGKEADFYTSVKSALIESSGNLVAANSVYLKNGALVFGDSINTDPSIIKSDNFFKIKKGDMYGIQAGKLLLSDTDSTAEQDKVPANGIYSKGAVISSAGFSSAVKVTDLIMAKTGNDVLNISSFNNGTANTPGSHAISGEQVNDGVALTYFWTTDYAVQLAIDIEASGMAYRKYTPSTGAATGWKFLANASWVNSKINAVASNYLPLAGGLMTGTIYLNNNVSLSSKNTASSNYNLVRIDTNNNTIISSGVGQTWIYSNDNDLYHYRNSTKYSIWDTYNLSQPATLNTGQTFTGIKTFNSRVVLNNDIPIVGLLADGSDFRNLLWMSTSNNPCFGSASAQPVIVSNATDIIHRRANTNYNIWDTYNLPRPVQTADLANYLPLSGGVITSSTAIPLTINGTGSASDIGIAVKRANVNKAYFGHNSNLGAFMYSYTRDKYLYISDTADEIIFGKTGSSKKLAFIDDIPSASGYLTKSVADATYLPIGGKGFLSIDSNGKPIMSNNQGYSAKQANGTVKEILWIGSDDNLNIGYAITHNAKIVTAGTLVTRGGLNYLYNRYSSPTFLMSVNINHNTSTGGWARNFNVIDKEGNIKVVFGGYGNAEIVNYAYIGAGSGVRFDSANNLKVYVDKVTFNNKQLATTDQIPSLSGYATQEWANTQFIKAIAQEEYVNISLPSAAQINKYLEWWDSQSSGDGWYKFHTGALTVRSGDVTINAGILKSTNCNNTVSIGSQNDKYCHIQNSANIPFHFNKDVKVQGNLYMGASYDKLVATQEWVTSQGFLKTDKDTHYTTMFNVGVATTKADAVATNPYFKLFDDSTLRKQIRINGSGATTVTSDSSGNIIISSTDTNTVYTLPTATASVLGGVKVGSNITVSSGTISLTKANVTAALGYTPPTTDTTYAQATSSALGLVKIGYAESGKNYPVELNSSGQMFVNVPWSDTNTTYSIATASVAGLVKPISVIAKPKLQSVSTTSERYYSVQMSSDGNMFVNVPWVNTNTTYGLASTTANGLLRQLNGSTSSFMRGDGTWATPPNTTYSVATTTSNGLMSNSDKTKLNDAIVSTGTNKIIGIIAVDQIPDPVDQTEGIVYLKFE